MVLLMGEKKSLGVRRDEAFGMSSPFFKRREPSNSRSMRMSAGMSSSLVFFIKIPPKKVYTKTTPALRKCRYFLLEISEGMIYNAVKD